MKYYILKQFAINAEIWVAKLDENDPEYIYSTLEEAEAALPSLHPLYPNRKLKVSNPVTSVL